MAPHRKNRLTRIACSSYLMCLDCITIKFAGVGMGDIKSPKLLYFKGFLFFAMGVLAAGIVLLLYPDWRLEILLGVMVWAFARAYYFVFYVIEHYIDPEFKFAGLVDFGKYVLKRRYRDTGSNHRKPPDE